MRMPRVGSPMPPVNVPLAESVARPVRGAWACRPVRYDCHLRKMMRYRRVYHVDSVFYVFNSPMVRYCKKDCCALFTYAVQNDIFSILIIKT